MFFNQRARILLNKNDKLAVENREEILSGRVLAPRTRGIFQKTHFISEKSREAVLLFIYALKLKKCDSLLLLLSAAYC